MQKRNKTVAVIGAGDFIGGEIAKKFASEGFTIFAGRRNGDKLAPLVKEIEAALAAGDIDERLPRQQPQPGHGRSEPGRISVPPAQHAGEGMRQRQV